ncbi:DedA family protein [Agromyces cerinus]|uniref:Membrane protein DedA, SNARE-associated domain n=1 Tax=Agromyces cerinus subsp. cerinus TaxID=232089 RepID=A0A1N6H9X6_9MICO|nr:DedA family protein [Agromyces cerinus]SIO16495.1 membrane protein DedA, SNARE-associated domain [Agromyces cerinus subsp. cerinus]
MDDAWLVSLAASPWLLPALFALVVGDAFLVVLPSETLVVALGALSATTGSPALWQVVPVAAAGAVVGDGLCYLIGRRVGLDRWRWQRTGRIGAAIERIRTAVHRRTALLVFTARYVPFARIAVNLAAGAGRVPLRRYLPLSAAAGIAWASYNVAIGAIVGSVLRDSPLVAIAVSVPVAIALGLLVDRTIALLDARRARPGAGVARPGDPGDGLTPP